MHLDVQQSYPGAAGTEQRDSVAGWVENVVVVARQESQSGGDTEILADSTGTWWRADPNSEYEAKLVVYLPRVRLRMTTSVDSLRRCDNGSRKYRVHFEAATQRNTSKSGLVKN